VPLAALVDSHLDDPGSGWSIGVPGAIAEFVRTAEEPVVRGRGSAVTDRGGIRLDLPAGTRALAYRTPVGPHDHWNHAVALCLPVAAARRAARTVVTELGPDRQALRPADAGAALFDLGLGVAPVDACVRTADPDLRAVLRDACGRSLFTPGSPLAARLVAAGPHRVFLSALGRVEVYVAIPPADGRSPDGPHTHLLPNLLRAGRTHAATVPVPDGYLPCAHLYPAHPSTDVIGRPVPFDPDRLAAFDRLLDAFGDPGQATVTAAVTAAVRNGSAPDGVPRPADPPGRAAWEVALRVLARTGGDPAVLAAWRGRGGPAGDLLDHDGDRNAG
jgi:hypothetical protein